MGPELQAIEAVKKGWRQFKLDAAGERFQKRYERRQRKRGGKSRLKPVYMIAGVLLALAGAFFMLVPGPGIPIFLLGAALIAGESLRCARWLDRLELRWRRWRDR